MGQFHKQDKSISEETTLIEVAENSKFFKEEKPFLVENLTSGLVSFRESNAIEVDMRDFVEPDAQVIIDILATTKVRKTNIEEDLKLERYQFTLSNRESNVGYTMDIPFMVQKSTNSNEILISTNFSRPNYITEDLRLYNKLDEIMEKAPSD